MVDLPKKKVGIVACSGEELPEGTVTRLAALRVLEQLRPAQTVTICLPLFLAGGQADRAFARFYPTIAVDGCELRCAARATEIHSGRPAAAFVVRDLITENGLVMPVGRRHLNAAGHQAVDVTAVRLASTVDELLDLRWDRSEGVDGGAPSASASPGDLDEVVVPASCSCTSEIPTASLRIGGGEIRLVALPDIFEQLREKGVPAARMAEGEILEAVKVYNPVPPEEEAEYAAALLLAYQVYLGGGA